MINLLKKHQNKIIITLITLGIIFASIGLFISDKTTNDIDILFNIVLLATLQDLADRNIFITTAKLLFLIAASLGIMVLFFSKAINRWLVSSIQRKPYSLMLGYGEQNTALLDEVWSADKTIVVEPDENEVKDVASKGFGVVVAKAEEVIAKLKLDNLERCIISIGNDRQNIAICLDLISALPEKSDTRIFVRVENRDLSVLFSKDSLHKHDNVDVIPFSVNEIMAKDLFMQHSVLGIQTQIIDTAEEYAVIVVGAGNLAAEIVTYLASISHLPEQNMLTIYCIDYDAVKFVDSLHKRFSGIDRLPYLSLLPLVLSCDEAKFYTDKVWKTKNLSNIYVATDDENKNLDITINLRDTTYVKNIGLGNFKTKILFAIFHSTILSKQISNNDTGFANFFNFADFNQVITKNNLIDEQLDIIAKLIHFGYSNLGDKFDKSKINQAWSKLDLHAKDSNKSQAQHIDVKLLALGLMKIKSNKSLDELIKINENILSTKIDDYEKLIAMLNKFTADDFPESFDSLINKIARSEHNRWNAFHYLRGWQYDENRNGKAKLHDCLLPIEDFKSDSLQDSYKYDLRSIIDMPKYLSYAGYEITPLQSDG